MLSGVCVVFFSPFFFLALHGFVTDVLVAREGCHALFGPLVAVCILVSSVRAWVFVFSEKRCVVCMQSQCV